MSGLINIDVLFGNYFGDSGDIYREFFHISSSRLVSASILALSSKNQLNLELAFFSVADP